MKTLRFQLLLWGLTLALVPTLFFAVWFWRYGLSRMGAVAAYLNISFELGTYSAQSEHPSRSK